MIPQGSIVFLHGLESRTDEHGIPNGGKASFLSANYGASLPALDTRAAIAARDALPDPERWEYPYPGYDEAFRVPMERARQAISAETRLVIGSSFGGAVLLRLLHEGGWSGPSIFMAGAGLKLTPHRTLPEGVRCLLIHGLYDDVVPLADASELAATSPAAELWEVDDGHRLASTLTDGTLDRAITWALQG